MLNEIGKYLSFNSIMNVLRSSDLINRGLSDPTMAAEWSKTLISQIQVENTVP